MYLVTIYKGFNALSNLGFDLGLPGNAVEMVWAIFVMGFQVSSNPRSLIPTPS